MFSISDKNVMALTKGDTAHFTVVVKNLDGTDYTLQTGDVITFTVKKGIVSRVPLIKKTTNIDYLGVVTILPADTKKLVISENLAIGVSYVYDIQIKLANGDINTMIKSAPFVLDGEVTIDE